jgi:hypothetical protein
MLFDDISYLKSGTPRQRKAYKVLHQNRILEKLYPFRPVLAGTIPVNIDIATSDLDILCHLENKEDYIKRITDLFQHQENFSIRERNDNWETVVTNFFADDFEIEIFAQNIPCHQQVAYRHLLIEHNLLNQYGEAFRLQVIDLKKQGYKTEPAFAKLLKLEGDPYMALLQLEADTDGPSKHNFNGD